MSTRADTTQRSITAKRRVFVMGHMGEAKWFRLVALPDPYNKAVRGRARQGKARRQIGDNSGVDAVDVTADPGSEWR